MTADRAAFRRARPRRLWIALAATLVSVAPAGHGPAPSSASIATGVHAEAPRGRIVHRRLRGDPHQQYLVYVPTRARPGAPIFVAVHGVSRNVEEHAKLFAPHAEQRGVVLIAPSFPEPRHAGYQRLSADGVADRADRALDAIVKEVAGSTGADGRRFWLFGFSGGAQFAHRYLFAHPDRVVRVAIGAAGWYTFPDERTPYPYGLGPSAERRDLRFDAGRFLRVPVTVFVGLADTSGGEHLRRNARVDRQQGTTRLDRARRWVAAMNRAARSRGLPPPASCHEVPGIEHSFRQFMTEGDLGERVFDALFESPTAGAHP